MANSYPKYPFYINVAVYENVDAYNLGKSPVVDYTMNYNDVSQRRLFGEQSRSALYAGQIVIMWPVAQGGENDYIA